MKTGAPRNAAREKHLRETIEAIRTCADPQALARAVMRNAGERLSAFADGVLLYHAAPRPARPPEPPVIWQRGAARLLDFGILGQAGDRPVLIVPSLVNRYHVLDLTAERSLVRHLAGAGLRPLLIDWGAPGEAERHFDLTDYIAGYLCEALAEACRAASRPVVAVGYCMGGLLALAAAQRESERTAGLALLATPWDFHAETPMLPYLRAMAPGFEALLSQLGHFPVDVLQAMFASLEPTLAGEKFRRFAHLAGDGDAARLFVALEDWLNDGVPLTAAVTRECLFGWYLQNSTTGGAWQVGGMAVDPTAIRVPSLVVIPERDHIVPPGSAAPLAALIGGADVWSLAAGHIGMVSGGRARELLYDPLAAWLNARFA